MSIFGKASRIRKVIRHAAVSRSEVIYIGDQLPDLVTAQKEQVAFGAVIWGYGAIESMRRHFPEVEFDTVSSIGQLAVRGPSA